MSGWTRAVYKHHPTASIPQTQTETLTTIMAHLHKMLALQSFLLLLLFCCSQARKGFLLTAPKVLLSGTSEKLCMSFHELEEDVHVNISLVERSRTLTYEQYLFEGGANRCVDFQVPSGLEEKKLSIHAEGYSGDYNFSQTAEIGINTDKTLTFIQTDKPIYKPGQKVQFRVITLSSDLKPKDVEIASIVLEDPSGSRIMQWNALRAERGLLSLDLPLSEEPSLGTWKIKISILDSEQEQTFRVEEYVLPKFDVSVEAPSYILINQKSTDVTVCSKYTYGEPVVGSMTIKATIIQSYYGQRKRPTIVLRRENVRGCVTVTIDSENLELDSPVWSTWNARLEVSATMTESATGVSITGNSSRTTVERDPLKIDLKSNSPEHFKPGLPFMGKGLVTKPDGEPAVGETILLTMNNYRRNKNYERNFTTDENGEFTFTLPAVEKSVVSLMIHARAPKYDIVQPVDRQRLYLPTSYHSIKQWYSPSGSYLQIDPVQQVVHASTTIRLHVAYTTTEESTHTFFYQLMSRGNIMHSGQVQKHFKSSESSVRRKRTSMPIPPIFPEDPKDDPVAPILNFTSSFYLDLFIQPEMSPSINLLVYYLHDNGEVVADNIVITVHKSLRNNVSLNFGAEEVYPGEAVSIDMKADPGSLCALGVVDKSVQILGGSNYLDINKVFASIKGFELNEHSGPYFHDDYCNKQIKDTDPGFGIPPPPGLPGPPGPPGGPFGPLAAVRRKRTVWPGSSGYSKYYDSSQAFKLHGSVVLSDLTVETRPCEREIYTLRVHQPLPQVVDDVGFGAAAGGAGPKGSASLTGLKSSEGGNNRKSSSGGKSNKKVVDIRNYFPETWVWDIVNIGSSGKEVLSEVIPHSITEWVGSAVCTNGDTGLGISNIASVRAFQPFFASFTLPYSVIRGEKVPVLISVFNYLSECLVVELTLKKEGSFRIASTSRNARVCVCGSETATHTFHVVPTDLGQVNITVIAESVVSNEVCGNGVAMSSKTGERDVVTRPIIVEAEGREEEYSEGSFICPDDQTYVETFNLPVPENFIEGSARGYITAIGDVMGPSLSGLDALLRLPTGCGEQNMLKFAPNIFILQYLTETNQDAPKIRKKALEYMRTGYQRELTYRHDDGSYSAFGNSDSEGSMWLTAFVVKSFAQARSFIYIDQDDLDKSISWFKSKQLENGCFPLVGKVLHKAMKGGLASGGNPTAGLTAYVLATMLRAGVEKQDQAVQDALLCLRSQTVNDPYTLSLMAYAYTLYDHTYPQRAEVLDTLDQMAVRGDGMLHWETPKTKSAQTNARFYHIPQAADVEMTAYVLLAHVMGRETSAIQTGQPIVRWISTQRNAYGGFASTQDTVVALQSLARYASLTYGSGSNLKIRVLGLDLEHRFEITDLNKFVLFSQKINVSNELAVTARGQGCAFFQANVKYNMPLEEETPKPAFNVRVAVPNRGVGSGSDACKKRKITVCTRYTEEDSASNMAIVAVKMVSGWIPVKETINKLKEDKELGLKRIEIDHNWVNFYFDEFTSETKCVTFVVEQDMEIEHVKPAFVHVYDYYQPELSVKKKYKIRRVCGTKNELPVISREEFENGDPMEQKRVPVEFPPELSLNGPLGGQLEDVCPVCLTEMPEDFVRRFCLSRHAYKTEVRNKGRYPLKVLTDYRLEKKHQMQRYINYTVSPVCPACDLLSRKSNINKIIILTKETEVQETPPNRGSLRLQNDVTMIPVEDVKQVQRRIRRLHKNKTCDK